MSPADRAVLQRRDILHLAEGSANAALLLSLAEDETPFTDPAVLVFAHSGLPAHQVRWAFRELLDWVVEWNRADSGVDGAFPPEVCSDELLRILAGLVLGKRPCAACVVRVDTVGRVRADDSCPFPSHRRASHLRSVPGCAA